MRKLFIRNSPETIKDALELSCEDFVKKYKPTTSTDEILSKVYLEIKSKYKAPEPKVEQPLEKRVTFKVTPTGRRVNTGTVVAVIPEDKEEEEIKKIGEEYFLEPRRLKDNEMLAEGELPEGLSAKDIKVIGEAIIDPEEPNEALKSAAETYKERLNRGNQLGEYFENTTAPTVKKRGKKPADNADKRDSRIVELLKEKKKGVAIIQIMKEEGYTVHAPQISNLKAIYDL
jgi:hypothetical protein